MPRSYSVVLRDEAFNLNMFFRHTVCPSGLGVQCGIRTELCLSVKAKGDHGGTKAGGSQLNGHYCGMKLIGDVEQTNSHSA